MYPTLAESLAGTFRQRLQVWNLWNELVEKVGITELEWAIEESASFYGDRDREGDGIGTSDIAHMIDGLLRRLGQPGLWDESRTR